MNDRNLTEGNIRRQLIRLAVPLIAGNILQQLYNTIDTLVVGYYCGRGQFAAVGVAGTVMNLFLFSIVGACSGISILFAQYYGAEREDYFRGEHAASFFLGLFGTAVLSIAGLLLLKPVLKLLQTPSVLSMDVSVYLNIVLAGLPAAFLYNFYSAILRSVGNTRIALGILAVSAAVNIVLDFFMVGTCGMEISGAAYATVAAEILSAVLCILYLRYHYPELMFQRKDLKTSGSYVRRTVLFASVSGFHQAGLYLGKLLVQGSVNTCGTEMVAAYTATGRIEGFANSFGDSGAAATSVLVAQNYGAGEKKRVKKAFGESLRLLVILGLISASILFLTAKTAAGLMLGTQKGVSFQQAYSYLRVISFFYLFCFTGNTYAGYYDGIGKPLYTFFGAAGHIFLRALLARFWVGRYGLASLATATGLGWILVNLFWTFLLYERKRTVSSRKYE